MERMQPQEIIEKSDEVKESNLNWKLVYATIMASIQSNQYRVMRGGNTLFWYKMLKKDEAQVFVFNADSKKNLIKNFKDFAKAMDVAGFKRVFGDTHDVQMLNVIKRVGYPVDIKEVGTDDLGRKLYRGTVNV